MSHSTSSTIGELLQLEYSKPKLHKYNLFIVFGNLFVSGCGLIRQPGICRSDLYLCFLAWEMHSNFGERSEGKRLYAVASSGIYSLLMGIVYSVIRKITETLDN